MGEPKFYYLMNLWEFRNKKLKLICKQLVIKMFLCRTKSNCNILSCRIIEVCLRLWNRSKQGYSELRESGLFKLPSGRTLQMRKNFVRQVPGLNQDVFNAMKEEASKRDIPATGYHGFVVFDEMSIQVGC